MPTSTTEIASVSGASALDEAMIATLSRLLEPIARLCLANGLTYGTVEEMLKLSFVRQANALAPEAPQHGTVSRISTATGLNRREVTRLVNSSTQVRPTKPLLATEVFARWTTDPAYRDEQGAPLKLTRQGPAPSFESLAHSVTRDVHPRCMLDDLVRLAIVEKDEVEDVVSLASTAFVPQNDSLEMLGLLCDNIGDHLESAVGNVLNSGSNLEQAVFADELSEESVENLRPVIKAQWDVLREALVPAITALIEDDRVAGRKQDQRVRIGMYGFSAPAGAAPPRNNAVGTTIKPSPGKKGVK